jgi:uncharacterized protein YgbK (DUF1537 family)
VAESHVPTLVGGSHIAHEPEESVRTLADRIAAGGRVVVVDAADDDRLQRLAEAVALLGSRAISVGSAGLARHLARVWHAEKGLPLCVSSVSSVVKDTVVKSRITLVIVTSSQDVARRQAAAVAKDGATCGQPAPNDLIDDDAWERWSATILDSLGTSAPTLLLTAPFDRQEHLPAALIPERFADLTARIIRKAAGQVSGVVVTGGDGARAVARALGASGLRILGEVTSGVPVGTLIGGPADGLHLVTKAGGFGESDTLLQAARAVRDWSDA